jgi:glycolate oxidase FAD binding subunit
MPNVSEAQRFVLAIQNSKLAHAALQVCCGTEMQPRVDVLLEGTEAGLPDQAVQLKVMASEARQGDAIREVWKARQEIHSRVEKDQSYFAVAKFATLPAELADTVELIGKVAGPSMRWTAVVEATGIGWVRVGGEVADIAGVLRRVREWLEDRGGSLVVLHRPAGVMELDVWGREGDALRVMQAVKRQFDPGRTLNPGRFVGGI